MSLPNLASKDLWEKVGRWSQMGKEMFQVVDRNGRYYCLQPTAEEMIAQIIAQKGPLPQSAFPLMLYQTGSKFRDELNPRFGLLRSREFIMNDLYTFHLCAEEASRTYQIVSDAYVRILRDSLEFDLKVVDADNGNIGGIYSNEYHVQNSSGEDHIVVCNKCNKGLSWDLHLRGQKPCDDCTSTCTSVLSTVEIAHTFNLGDEFSVAFGALCKKKPLIMNCFGLGVGRIISAAVDVFSPNASSMRLPYQLCPFKLGIVTMRENSIMQRTMQKFLNDILKELDSIPGLSNEILVDDRCEKSYGRRLQSLEKLGIPHILVLGNESWRNFDRKPLIEYFRTAPNNPNLIQMPSLTHSDLFSLAQSL